MQLKVNVSSIPFKIRNKTRMLSVMGWIVCPCPQVNWSPNSQDLRTWPYLEIGSIQKQSSENEVIRVDSNPTWLVSLLKRGNLETDTFTGRVLIWRQPSTSQGKNPGRKPFLTTIAVNTLISDIQKCKIINLCYLSHSVCGTLLRQP